MGLHKTIIRQYFYAPTLLSPLWLCTCDGPCVQVDLLSKNDGCLRTIKQWIADSKCTRPTQTDPVSLRNIVNMAKRVEDGPYSVEKG